MGRWKQDGTFIDYQIEGEVGIKGTTVVEQKTQADAVAGVVTFAANVETLEIYNVDGTNTGVFTVNGINITVPSSAVHPQTFKATFGGTASPTVTVTGSTSYILTRYE